MRLDSQREAKTREAFAGKPTALSAYPLAVHYLLRTYSTNENITNADDKTTTSIHTPNKTPSQHTEELVAKKLCCGDGYEEQDLEIFIKRLDKSIRQSLRAYPSTQKTASLHELASNITSLLKLQRGHQDMPSTNTTSKENQN